MVSNQLLRRFVVQQKGYFPISHPVQAKPSVMVESLVRRGDRSDLQVGEKRFSSLSDWRPFARLARYHSGEIRDRK